ncbi:MAG: metallophosphoesterase family protein [Bacillota bacterium]|nr:metallophosphoesterase family protein [Bacillota bacterium]
MIYFTSDWHFNHQKDFIWQPRGFNTVQEMNETIVKKWNEIITWEDIVYVLGDCGLGGGGDEALAAIKYYIQQLNGKIKIIFGNHDTESRINMYKTCYNVDSLSSDSCCYATMVHYKGYHFYLSHYPTMCSNLDDDKPLKARIISLCGHTHTNNPFLHWNNGLIYHVEVDAHNCYPVSIDQIIEELKTKISAL